MQLAKYLAFAALLAGSAVAQAHFVWLERDGDGPTRAYFGEWAYDQREPSEGLLGKVLSTPRVTLAGKPLVATRQADHLSFDSAAAGDVRLAQSFVHGETLVHFRAKAGRTETAAGLPFELVPVAPGSNTFTLLLDGKPLPKTEVTVFGPPKWSKAFHSDDAGRLTIETPWPGQYVLEAAHNEARAGKFGERAYQKVRSVATLSFTVAQ